MREPTDWVPANKFLFAGTVPANMFLFAGTVPANNLFLINIRESEITLRRVI